MSAAVAAILEGMPEPRDLRMFTSGGRCVISGGSVVLFEYDAADTAMRTLRWRRCGSWGSRAGRWPLHWG
jgi:hypothetical protein